MPGSGSSQKWTGSATLPFPPNQSTNKEKLEDLLGVLVQAEGVEQGGVRHGLLEVVVGRPLLLRLLLKVPRSFAEGGDIEWNKNYVYR